MPPERSPAANALVMEAAASAHARSLRYLAALPPVTISSRRCVGSTRTTTDCSGSGRAASSRRAKAVWSSVAGPTYTVKVRPLSRCAMSMARLISSCCRGVSTSPSSTGTAPLGGRLAGRIAGPRLDGLAAARRRAGGELQIAGCAEDQRWSLPAAIGAIARPARDGWYGDQQGDEQEERYWDDAEDQERFQRAQSLARVV